ncbi:hypothetical protein [Nitrosopumilus cobalaminigenes]|nr:hypothetical protein [Nitrosopumilus cobalaminigenes]
MTLDMSDLESVDRRYKRKLNQFKKLYKQKKQGVTLYDYALKLAHEKWSYARKCCCIRCIVAGTAVSKYEYFFNVVNDLFNDENFKTKRKIPDSYYHDTD